MNRIGMMLVLAAVLSIPFAGATAASSAQSGDAAKGQKLYTAQKCSICHRIGDQGGKLGPDLTTLAAKRDAAWLRKYLPDPKAVDPKNKMPATKLAAADMDDLIAYLLTLKGAQ